MKSTITEQNIPFSKPSFHDQEEIAFVKLSKDTAFRKIYLTEDKSAWLTMEWLSDTLFHYVQDHYQELFDLHPENRGKVILYNEEIQSSRWHRSYLETPVRNPDHSKTSYMYSGSDFYDDLSLPHPFQPFLDFLNETQGNDPYNQVIVNWYANGNDYIAAHSDCRLGMQTEAEIAIITLCAHEDARELQFISKNLKNTKNNALYKKLSIETANGCIIKMHGDTQLKFRHKVPKAPQISGSRISLTFRKFAIGNT